MLLSKADFATNYLDLPATINTAKLNRAMQEAEDMDLSLYFNEAFLKAMATGGSPDIYAVIKDGTTYTHTNGEEKSFRGIKTVLCYFAYSRLFSQLDNTFTSNSIVYKEGEYSTRISGTDKAQNKANLESAAKFHLSKVIEYILDNIDTYTLYNYKHKNSKFKVYG